MNMESYLGELTAQLQRLGVSEGRIGEIIAEVESHLTESGEMPVEAFGPAAEYAEEMAALAEKNSEHTDDSANPANNPNPADLSTIRYHHRTFRATAIDEMGILKYAGKDGWELVDVGALALFCRRPVDLSLAHRWEYKRRTGTHNRIIKEEMAAAQWEPCGNWIVFHYFKRENGIR
ncbi:MAG: hypothetical protein KOO60_02670 [Gemmatimonadales bacterium]|nr:hypothetical protein [Gemmatimonadales bacterium]